MVSLEERQSKEEKMKRDNSELLEADDRARKAFTLQQKPKNSQGPFISFAFPLTTGRSKTKQAFLHFFQHSNALRATTIASAAGYPKIGNGFALGASIFLY
jgi:hypothetical protein